MFSIFRPYIFALDPEVAHDLAIKSLKANILPKSFFNVEDEDILKTNLLGKISDIQKLFKNNPILSINSVNYAEIFLEFNSI